MGIFGRRTARRRLRRATEESLTVPTFSAPVDCTPWVIGDLWPTALSAGNTETATIAQHLRLDLQRIANSANEDLRAVGRTAMAYPLRRAAEARVIDEARALAVRRVDSTMRQLRQQGQDDPEEHPLPHAGTRPPLTIGPADMDRTQVLPVVRDVRPPVDLDKTQVIPAVRAALPHADPTPSKDEPPEAALGPVVAAADQAKVATSAAADQRLPRLLAFVARQEPRLSWAVGERSDGTTVLVTDLAHGWIPPGIAIPDGVRLLEPGLRSGGTSELLGTTTRSATYAPGDSTDWTTDVAGIESSVQARELPTVYDLGRELEAATQWREGVPRLVHALTNAAAGGTDIVEQEIDLLRVHLDTARYQILAQYPDVDPVQLVNCMLFAAAERSVSGDKISSNYHFAWFRKLDDKPSEKRSHSRPESAR